MKVYLYTCISLFVCLVGCKTTQFAQPEFGEMRNLSQLQGTYLNAGSSRNLLSLFKIQDYANYVELEFEDANTLTVTYQNDRVSRGLSFKGELKERGYFEINFDGERVIVPPLYTSIRTDRLRIGRSTTKGELLIESENSNYGNVMILFGEGYKDASLNRFKLKESYTQLVPQKVNDKYGYVDSQGETIIPPRYDYALTVDRGLAYVKLDDKWGIITPEGDELTPVKYDWLSRVHTTKGTIGMGFEGKSGLLNTEGNEVIPPFYDFIDMYTDMGEGLFLIGVGENVGYANHSGVVIPAIYQQIDHPNKEGYIEAVRGEQKYWVDMRGYEYGYVKNIKQLDTTAGRKIELSEQFE